MIKPILNTEYTQINTNTASFVLQNISLGNAGIIISDTQPNDNSPHELILKYTDGITDKDLTGIVWAKSFNPTGVIGIIEG